MSYTKGKWVVIDIPDTTIGDGWDIVDENNNTIFTNNKANAKRIVHCVNNYDGLVEACKKNIARLKKLIEPNMLERTIIEDLEQAIKKAIE